MEHPRNDEGTERADRGGATRRHSERRVERVSEYVQRMEATCDEQAKHLVCWHELMKQVPQRNSERRIADVLADHFVKEAKR